MHSIIIENNDIQRHFDLNTLWTQQKEFSIDVFVTIVKTMQVRRYWALSKSDVYSIMF